MNPRSLVLLLVVLFVPRFSFGATTTLTTGGADSWNTGTWSLGVPSGNIDAEVSAGVQADVSNGSTPSYSGNLFLRDGAKLTIANDATDMNALGGGNIHLHNATLDIDRNVDFSIGNVHVTGNGIMELRDLSNNNLPRFAGNISGTGNLYFPGVYNNEAIIFESPNDISGGMIFTTSNRGAVVFEQPLSAGKGNITMKSTSTSGRYIWIDLRADDVFDDNATLSVNGTEGSNGGMGTSYGSFGLSALIDMNNYDDTIGQLIVNDRYYGAGNYSGTAGAGVDHVVTWLAGTGILTVSTAPPDPTPPTVNFVAVDHDGGAGPVYPDETLTYTVVFDEPVTPNPATSDFENALTTAISVESVTRVDDLTFTVEVKAMETGSVNLQIRSGASIEDFSGNPLVTPAVDDQTFTVLANPPLKGELGLWKPWANSGINPNTGVAWKRGDQYRYIFVSSGTRDATSTDINDYNDFVQASANTGTASVNLVNVIWKAVGSTNTVDAKTNTDSDDGVEVGVPILLMDGFTTMAGNNVDLWDGVAKTSTTPLYDSTYITPFLDEDGSYINNWVWTGTDTDGTGYDSSDGEELGTVTDPSDRVRRGNTTDTGAGSNSWLIRANNGKTNNYRIYGMSEVLTLISTQPKGTIIRVK